MRLFQVAVISAALTLFCSELLHGTVADKTKDANNEDDLSEGDSQRTHQQQQHAEQVKPPMIQWEQQNEAERNKNTQYQARNTGRNNRFNEHREQLVHSESGGMETVVNVDIDSRYIGYDRAPANRKRRVSNDLLVHAMARGFEYHKNLANEFQLIDPSKITRRNINSASQVAELSEYNSNPAEYNFTSITPLIINNDDIVTVSFASSNPYYGDWIGAYRFMPIHAIFFVFPLL